MSYLTDIRLTIRALVKLNMSDNNFYGAEAGKILGDMLAANTVLKELDLSKCNMRTESTQAFAVGLSTNGALTSLNLSENKLGTEGAKHVAEAVKDHVSGLLYSVGSI